MIANDLYVNRNMSCIQPFICNGSFPETVTKLTITDANTSVCTCATNTGTAVYRVGTNLIVCNLRIVVKAALSGNLVTGFPVPMPFWDASTIRIFCNGVLGGNGYGWRLALNNAGVLAIDGSGTVTSGNLLCNFFYFTTD